VSATDEVRYLREFDHLSLVRLLLAQHRAHQDSALGQAAGLLDRLYAAAETAERARSLFEIRLLQALVQDAQGHLPRALEILAQALALAPEPESCARLLLDEGAPMMSLLREANREGVVGGQARRLLHRCASSEAQAPKPVQRAAESLSDRELQVLRLLNSELTGPEIAQELFVSPNTLRTHTKHIFTRRHQPAIGGPSRTRTRPHLTCASEQARGLGASNVHVVPWVRSPSHPVGHIIG